MSSCHSTAQLISSLCASGYVSLAISVLEMICTLKASGNSESLHLPFCFDANSGFSSAITEGEIQSLAKEIMVNMLVLGLDASLLAASDVGQAAAYVSCKPNLHYGPHSPFDAIDWNILLDCLSTVDSAKNGWQYHKIVSTLLLQKSVFDVQFPVGLLRSVAVGDAFALISSMIGKSELKDIDLYVSDLLSSDGSDSNSKKELFISYHILDRLLQVLRSSDFKLSNRIIESDMKRYFGDVAVHELK